MDGGRAGKQVNRVTWDLGSLLSPGHIPGLMVSPRKLMSRNSQESKWAPQGIVILQLKDNNPDMGRAPRCGGDINILIMNIKQPLKTLP